MLRTNYREPMGRKVWESLWASILELGFGETTREYNDAEDVEALVCAISLRFLPFMWQCLKDVFGKLGGGFLFSSKSEAPYLLDVKGWMWRAPGFGPIRVPFQQQQKMTCKLQLTLTWLLSELDYECENAYLDYGRCLPCSIHPERVGSCNRICYC